VAQQPFDALAHLARGLVGERDREDLARLGLVGVDQIGDAVGEHAGLAAAGTGEYQQGALAVRDRLPLGLVQSFQELLEVLGVGVCGHWISSIDAHSAGVAAVQPGASAPAVARRRAAAPARAVPAAASRRPGWGP
jgi:hypothetical protein